MAENTNLAPIWLILSDQNYAIRFAPDAYCIDFLVFGAAEGWAANEDISKPGTWEIAKDSDYIPLALWEQADWEISGEVKWDGCINWTTNPDCMVHGCGPHHADAIAIIFRALYTVAKRYFDLLGDPVEALPERAFEILPESLDK